MGKKEDIFRSIRETKVTANELHSERNTKAREEIRESEIQKVSEVVRILKGERSVRQLSVETGIALSYLSGIINGRFMPSPDILKKLASSESNPRGGITLEDLMIAAGYQDDYREENKFIDETETSEPYNYRLDRMRRHSESVEYINKLKQIGSGIIYKKMIDNSIIFRPSERGDLPIRGVKTDIQLDVEKQYIKEWWIKFQYIPSDVMDRGVQQQIKFFLSKVMFLDPNSKRKISFAVSSKKEFDLFVQYKDHLSYRGDLSILLLDLEDYDVTEETYLAHYNESDQLEFKLV